jgi:hypothetical protein
MSSSEGAPGSSEGAAAGGDEHAAAAARLLLRADAAQFNTHTLALGLRAAGADAAWCSVFVERCGADAFAESSDLLDGQAPRQTIWLHGKAHHQVTTCAGRAVERRELR